MAEVLKVDGFGGTVSERGESKIAADLTELGLRAEPLGTLRRSDPSTGEGWITLIGSADAWWDALKSLGLVASAFAAGGAAVAGAREVVGGVEAVRKSLEAVLGRREKHLVSAMIPYPWDEYTGAKFELRLAPDVFLDDVKMFADRAAGITRALNVVQDSGHLPLGNVEGLLSERGFRLRWTSRKGFARHEADFDVDGGLKGQIRAGWTDVKAFPSA